MTSMFNLATATRFNGGLKAPHTALALDNDQLRRVAPSIFAEKPWGAMSSKYQFFPTSQVIDKMRTEGFMPVKAGQGKCRIEGKGDFTKHIIRFRHQDFLARQTGDEIPEIVLLNSHDGTSAYKLMAGLFRVVCMNGLVVSSFDMGTVNVRHSGRGSLIDDVIEGTYTVVEDLPKIMGQVDAMKSTLVTVPQQEAFAKAALEVRDTALAIEPAALLMPRRLEDRAEAGDRQSVWKTLNVVQENLVRGGMTGTGSTGRRSSLRAIKNPNADLKTNRALWTLAQEFQKLAA